MPNDQSIPPPLQFTIRMLLLITAITAVGLGIIRVLGIGTAPGVLLTIGGLVGYLLGRPGDSASSRTLETRIAWILVFGCYGLVAGFAAAFVICAFRANYMPGDRVSIVVGAVVIVSLGYVAAYDNKRGN